MNRIRRALTCFVFAVPVALFASSPVRAQPVSTDDSKAVRLVVEAQLAAFAADDAKRAFSYAAPAIRDMFGSADRFMEMVRAGYPVVYRPASTIFLVPVRVQGQLVQGVQLTDADGTLWLAVYRLDRQPDRSWRISGCDVQRSSGKLT